MAYQSRASGVRHLDHFSALWSFILHRRVVSLLLAVSRSERACHPERRRREGPAFLSHLADGGNSRSFARAGAAPSDNLGRTPGRKQILRSRACRALAQDDNAARPPGGKEGGGRTCLGSAAGAKDLLFREISRLMAPRTSDAPLSRLVRAPGRVNLIGEHIDYCGLPVLPMALSRGVRIAFERRADRGTRLVNADARFAPSFFTIETSIPPAPAGDWSNYARAAAQALAQRCPDLRGVDALVQSDLPIAAGLSSSSALVVALALALLHANRVTVPPLELMELLAQGERYVGTAGGGMDQAIILGARAGCASRIDFRPLRLTPTPVPAGWQFIVAWSLVHAEKSGAARQSYNERTRQCDEARRLVATRLGQREDINYPALLAAAPVEQLLEVAGATGSDVLARRFRHVVTEGIRVRQAEAAMAAHDLAACGLLLDASHQSLRDD